MSGATRRSAKKAECPKETHDFIEQCQEEQKKNHRNASVLPLVGRVGGDGGIGVWGVGGG